MNKDQIFKAIIFTSLGLILLSILFPIGLITLEQNKVFKPIYYSSYQQNEYENRINLNFYYNKNESTNYNYDSTYLVSFGVYPEGTCKLYLPIFLDENKNYSAIVLSNLRLKLFAATGIQSFTLYFKTFGSYLNESNNKPMPNVSQPIGELSYTLNINGEFYYTFCNTTDTMLLLYSNLTYIPTYNNTIFLEISSNEEDTGLFEESTQSFPYFWYNFTTWWFFEEHPLLYNYTISYLTISNYLNLNNNFENNLTIPENTYKINTAIEILFELEPTTYDYTNITINTIHYNNLYFNEMNYNENGYYINNTITYSTTYTINISEYLSIPQYHNIIIRIHNNIYYYEKDYTSTETINAILFLIPIFIIMFLILKKPEKEV